MGLINGATCAQHVACPTLGPKPRGLAEPSGLGDLRKMLIVCELCCPAWGLGNDLKFDAEVYNS